MTAQISNLSDLVNSNARFFQASIDDDGNGPFIYRHHHLEKGITKWINIYRSLNLQKTNPSIGLLHELNFEYICMLYAAIGIGANFVVLESKFDDSSSHKDFMPLDILVYDDTLDNMCDDMSYWNNNSQHRIDSRLLPKIKSSDENTDTNDISSIDLNFDWSKTQMLSSATSGSTGVSKKITHNYQYILDISQRNAEVLNFNGRVVHIKNLYHGSTMPVFYLPALLKSDFHFCAPWIDSSNLEEIEKYIKNQLSWTEYLDINHILFPYTFMMDNFLNSVVKFNMSFTDLTVYTLSYIKPQYKNLIKGRNIKIVSIFGCTETSGPVMINSLTDSNAEEFDPTIFYTLDDYFTLTLLPDGTRVQTKNGWIDHVMDDKFKKIDHNCYQHLGKSNQYRINDVKIDLAKISNISKLIGFDGDIIVDEPQQSLYLVLWNNDDLQHLQDVVNQQLNLMFGSELVHISKAANLNKLEFISGIKINQDMIRQYFRNTEEH